MNLKHKKQLILVSIVLSITILIPLSVLAYLQINQSEAAAATSYWNRDGGRISGTTSTDLYPTYYSNFIAGDPDTPGDQIGRIREMTTIISNYNRIDIISISDMYRCTTTDMDDNPQGGPDDNAGHCNPSTSNTVPGTSMSNNNNGTITWTFNDGTNNYIDFQENEVISFGIKFKAKDINKDPFEAIMTTTAEIAATETTWTTLYTPNQTYVFNPPFLDIDKNIAQSSNACLSGQTCQVGDIVKFRIYAYNNGPGKAYNVNIKDWLPPELSYVAGSCTESCTTNGQEISWNSDTTLLANSANSLEYFFDAKIESSGAGQTLINEAGVTATNIQNIKNQSSSTTKCTSSSSPSPCVDTTGIRYGNGYMTARTSITPAASYTISGYLYRDNDADFSYDQNTTTTPPDTPINGHTVTLIENNSTLGTTTTNTNGYYEFQVPSGSYNIQVTRPTSYNKTLEPNPSPLTNPSSTKSVTISTSNSTNNNFGFYSTAVHVCKYVQDPSSSLWYSDDSRCLPTTDTMPIGNTGDAFNYKILAWNSGNNNASISVSDSTSQGPQNAIKTLPGNALFTPSPNSTITNHPSYYLATYSHSWTGTGSKTNTATITADPSNSNLYTISNPNSTATIQLQGPDFQICKYVSLTPTSTNPSDWYTNESSCARGGINHGTLEIMNGSSVGYLLLVVNTGDTNEDPNSVADSQISLTPTPITLTGGADLVTIIQAGNFFSQSDNATQGWQVFTTNNTSITASNDHVVTNTATVTFNGGSDTSTAKVQVKAPQIALRKYVKKTGGTTWYTNDPNAPAGTKATLNLGSSPDNIEYALVLTRMDTIPQDLTVTLSDTPPTGLTLTSTDTTKLGTKTIPACTSAAVEQGPDTPPTCGLKILLNNNGSGYNPPAGNATNTATTTYTGTTISSSATTQLDSYDININIYEDLNANGQYDFVGTNTDNLISLPETSFKIYKNGTEITSATTTSGTFTLTGQTAGSYKVELDSNTCNNLSTNYNYKKYFEPYNSITECWGSGQLSETKTIPGDPNFNFGFIKEYELGVEFYEAKPTTTGGYEATTLLSIGSTKNCGEANQLKGSLSFSINKDNIYWDTKTIFNDTTHPYTNFENVYSGTYSLQNVVPNISIGCQDNWVLIPSTEVTGTDTQTVTLNSSNPTDTIKGYLTRSKLNLHKYIYNGTTWDKNTPTLSIDPGSKITYLIVAENTGGASVSGKTITDQFTQDTDLITSSNPVIPGSATYDSSSKTITLSNLTIDKLQASGNFNSTTPNIDHNTSPQQACQANYCYLLFHLDLPTTFNKASARLDNTATMDTLKTTRQTTVNYAPDITYTKTITSINGDPADPLNPPALNPGDTFSFTITAHNNGSSKGPANFRDVLTGNNDLLAYANFLNGTFNSSYTLTTTPSPLANYPNNFSCTYSTSILTISCPNTTGQLTLAPGELVELKISFQVKDRQALLNLNNPDWLITNSFNGHTIQIPVHLYTITKTQEPATPIIPPISGSCSHASEPNPTGCTTLWQLNVTHLGPSSLGTTSGLEIHDTLPPNFSYLPGSLTVIGSGTIPSIVDNSPNLIISGGSLNTLAPNQTLKLEFKTYYNSIDVPTTKKATNLAELLLNTTTLAQDTAEVTFDDNYSLHLQGFVWFDTITNDLMINNTETPYNQKNLQVSLLDSNQKAITGKTAPVDSSGAYSITGIDPNKTYYLRLQGADLTHYKVTGLNYQGLLSTTNQPGLACDGTTNCTGKTSGQDFLFDPIKRTDGWGNNIFQQNNYYNFGLIPRTGQLKVQVKLLGQDGTLQEFPTAARSDLNWWLNGPQSFATSGSYQHNDDPSQGRDSRYYPGPDSATYSTVPIGSYHINSLSSPGYTVASSTDNPLCDNLNKAKNLSENAQIQFTLCLKPSQIKANIDKYVCIKETLPCQGDDWQDFYRLGEVDPPNNTNIYFLLIASNQSVLGGDIEVDIRDQLNNQDLAKYFQNRSSPLTIDNLELKANPNTDPFQARNHSYSNCSSNTNYNNTDPNITSFDSGATKALCYQVKLLDTAEDEASVQVVNTARLTDAYDMSKEYDSDSAAVLFSYTANLELGKTVSPNESTPVGPGDIVEYTLSVTNVGIADKLFYRFQDDLSDVLNYAKFVSADPLSATPGGIVAAAPTFVTSHDILDWGIVPRIKAGQTITTKFRVRITESDLWPAGIYQMVNTFGNPVTTQLQDIQVEKIALTPEINPPYSDQPQVTLPPDEQASIAQYRIRVHNRSNGPLSNIQVHDTLIQLGAQNDGTYRGFTFKEMLGGPLPGDYSDNTILWSLPTIPARGFEDIEFTAYNFETFEGDFTNTVHAYVGNLSDQDDAKVTIRQPLVTIEGYVWLDNFVTSTGDDEIRDGYIDNDEEGIRAVKVRLIDEYGRVIKEVQTNASGYYKIADSKLITGRYAKLEVVPNRSIYSPTGTNKGGIVKSFLLQSEGQRFPSLTSNPDLWKENTQFEIPNLTLENVDTTYNFGLDRLTGTIKVVIKDIYTGEIYKNGANPGVINFIVSPDGAFPSQDMNWPAGVAGQIPDLLDDPNYIGPTNNNNCQTTAQDHEMCDESGQNTEEGYYILKNMPTGSYQVSFVPPFGSNDVTPLASSSPYTTTILVNETGVIELWIAGDEDLKLQKYVWDPNATDSSGNTGLWVKNRDALPGEKIHYLVMASNSGSKTMEIAIDDVLPLFDLFDSRNHSIRPLLSSVELKGQLGTPMPNPNDSTKSLYNDLYNLVDQTSGTGIENCATDLRQFGDTNYFGLVYCEDLKSGYNAGHYHINNIARFGRGVLATSQAVVNVQYEANANLIKTHCLWDPTTNTCQTGLRDGSPTSPYIPGDFVRYQITIDNDSASTAPLQNYDVIDDLSDVLAYADIFPDSITHRGLPIGSSLIWSDLYLNAGQSLTLEYTAIIRDSDTWTRNEYIMDNAANGIHAPRAYLMDLKITKTPQHQLVNPHDMPDGKTARWTLTVTNRSNTTLPAGTVRIKDILEQYEPITGSGWKYFTAHPLTSFDEDIDTDDYPVYTYDRDFAPDSTIILNLNTQNLDLYQGTYQNTAQVQRNVSGTWETYDQDQAQVEIQIPNLRIEGYVWQENDQCLDPLTGTDCAIINPNEQGLVNNLIQLRDQTGNTLFDQVYTNSSGHYEFFNVPADKPYRIYQIQPQNFNSSGTNQGGKVGSDLGGQIANPAPTDQATWLQIGSGPNGNLVYNDSQTTYNFGEIPHKGDLKIYVWPVINGVRSSTPIDYNNLEVSWTISGPHNFLRSKQTSDTGAQPYSYSDIPVGFYNSILTSYPTGWTDVTNLIVGCNRTAQVQNNAPATVINLCLQGQSQLKMDKQVFDHVSQSWVTEASFDNGQEVHYAIRLWNTGTTDISGIDITDTFDNPNLLEDPQVDLAAFENINLDFPANKAACVPPTLSDTVNIGSRQSIFQDTTNDCWTIIHYSYKVKSTYISAGTFTNINLATFNDHAGHIGSDAAMIHVNFTATPDYEKEMVYVNSGAKDGQIPSSDLPAQPGDTIEYTLRASNIGNAPLVNWYIRDNLNDIIPYVNNRYTDISSTTGGVLAGREWIWGPFNINPGDNQEVKLQVRVGAAKNWVGDDLLMTNSYGSCNGDPGLCVVPLLDLKIQKTVLSPIVEPSSQDGVLDGGISSWEIRITNNSEVTLDSTQVEIIDTYDDMLEYLQSLSLGDITITPDPDPTNHELRITFTNGLQPGATRLIRYQTINTERHSADSPLENCAFLEYNSTQYGPLTCAHLLVEEEFGLEADKNLIDVDGNGLPSEVDVNKDSINEPHSLYLDLTSGHKLTYQINLKNTSNFELTDLDLLDLLPIDSSWHQFDFSRLLNVTIKDETGAIMPAGTINVSAQRQANGQIRMAIDDLILPEGWEVIIQYEVEIPPQMNEKCDLTGYKNYLQVMHEGHTKATASDNIILCSRDIDLLVTKDNHQTTLQPGQSTTYDITIENIGRDDALDVILTDQLPPNRGTIISFSNLEITHQGTTTTLNGIQQNNTVIWPDTTDPLYAQGFTLPSGASGRATLTVSVADTALQDDQFTNQIKIESLGSLVDIDPTNNQDQDTDYINASDIQITKTVASRPEGPFAEHASINIQDTAYFHITATNLGLAPATVDIVDQMMITTDASQDPNDLGADELTDLLTQVIVNGQSTLRGADGQPLTEFVGGVLHNKNVPDEGQYFLVADDITIYPGQSRTFTIQVTAQDHLTIPVDISPTSGNIDPVTGFVNQTVFETIENSAFIYDDTPDQENGNILAATRSSASLDIEAKPLILYTKSALDKLTEKPIDNATVRPGQEIIYVLTATNIGSAPATGFVFDDDITGIIDDLQSGTDVMILEQGEPLLGAGDPILIDGTYQPCNTCALGNQHVTSQPHSLPIQATIDPALSPTRYFQFKITVGKITDGDNILYNNYTYAQHNPFLTPADSDVTLENKAAILEIEKTVDQNTALYGEYLLYTIRVTNTGTYRADNIILIDTLPYENQLGVNYPQIKYAMQTTGATTHHPTVFGLPLQPDEDITLTWNVDSHGTPFSLEAGESLELHFKAFVDAYVPYTGDPNAYQDYINKACASYQDRGVTFNTTPCAQVSVDVYPTLPADVTISKNTNPPGATIPFGSNVNWSIILENNNPNRDENNIFIVDDLPTYSALNGTTYKMGPAYEKIGNNTYPKRAIVVIDSPTTGTQSFQMSPRVEDLGTHYRLSWPDNNQGFMLPRDGTITINFETTPPAIEERTGCIQMNNQARAVVGSHTSLISPGGNPVDTNQNVCIEPLPYTDVHLQKNILLGNRSSTTPLASPAQFTVDQILALPAPQITYEMIVYNSGTKDAVVRLIDSVDFTSPNSIYKELCLYDHNDTLLTNPCLTPENFTSSNLVLNSNLTLPKGSTATNAPTIYYLETTLRDLDFLGPDPIHTNIAQAQHPITRQVIDAGQAQATVQVTVQAPQLKVSKKVRSNFTFNFVDDLSIDPQSAPDPNNISTQYQIIIENTGDMPSEALDIIDFIDPNSSPIYREIIDQSDPLNPRTLPGNAGFIQLALGQSIPARSSLLYTLQGNLANNFIEQNPRYDNTVQLLKTGTNDLTQQVLISPDDAQDSASVTLDVNPHVILTKQVRNLSQCATCPFAGNSISAEPGDLLEYQITAQNIGLVAAQSLQIFDLLDNTSDFAGVTPTLHSQVYLLNPDSDGDLQNTFIAIDSYRHLSLNRPLQPGDAQSFTIRAQIRDPFPDISGRIINNTITATIANPGPNPILPTFSQTEVLFAAQPDIKKHVSLDNGLTWHDAELPSPFADYLQVAPGQTVKYKISLFNIGPGGINLNLQDNFTDPLDPLFTPLPNPPVTNTGANFNPDYDNDGIDLQGAYNTGTLFVPGNTTIDQAQTYTYESTIADEPLVQEDDILRNRAQYDNGHPFQDADLAHLQVHIKTPDLLFTKQALNITQSRVASGCDPLDDSCSLTTEIDAASSTAKPGELIRYTLTVENTGDAPYPDYLLEDDLTDTLEYSTLDLTSITHSGTFNTDPLKPNYLTWPLITIEPSQTHQRTFEITIQDPLPTTGDYIMENTLPLVCPPLSATCIPANLQIPVGDLVLSKQAELPGNALLTPPLPLTDLRPVRPGEEIEYILEATNNSLADITNFTLQDNIADILEYADLSNNGGGILNPLTATIEWTNLTIPATQTLERRFRVTIKPQDQWPTGGDLLLTNIYGNTIEIELLDSTIEVQKTLITPNVTAIGQTVKYQISLTNTGNVPIFDLKIRDIYSTAYLDPLPPGTPNDGGLINTSEISPLQLTHIEDTLGPLDRLLTDPIQTLDPAGLLCWQNPASPLSDCHLDQPSSLTPITNIFPNLPLDTLDPNGATLAALKPGQTLTFSTYYTAIQETPAGQPALNEVYLWAGDRLPNPQLEGGAQALLTINAIPLTIEKTVTPTTISQNAPASNRLATYTINLTNNGPFTIDSSQYQVIDFLPNNTDFLYQTGTTSPIGPIIIPEPNTITPGQLSWAPGDLPTIPAGQTIQWTYQILVNADTTGSPYTNTIQVQENTGDLIDEAMATLTVQTGPQINNFTKTVTPSQIMVTDPAPRVVVYTIEIDNTTGPDTHNLIVEDLLPTDFYYYPTGGSTPFPPQTSMVGGAQQLRWTSLSVPAGSTRSIIFAVQVQNTLPGTYINSAYLNDQFDQYLLGPAQAPVEIIGDAPFTINKTASPSEISAGQIVQYQILIQNIDPLETITGATLDDQLPPDFSYNDDATLEISGTTQILPPMWNPLTNPQHLNWNLPDILPGQSATLIYSTTAPTPLPIGSYTNTATLTYNHWSIQTSSTVYNPDPTGDPGPTPDTGSSLWPTLIAILLLIISYFILIKNPLRKIVIKNKI